MAKKKNSGTGVLSWLPFIIGIAVTPLALRAASVMALSGQDALTLLLPWSQAIRASFLRLPYDVAAPTSQLAMYLQFPIYGFVMSWQRRRGSVVSFGVVVFVHVVGIIAAIILKHLSNPALRFY